MPQAKDDKYGTKWSRDELILALYLYCQIPFAQTSSKNAEIIRLATLLGRTPSSVAKKLGNFGAFDPMLANRGVSGLTHGSKADKIIWDEFYGRWESLVAESQVLASRFGTDSILVIDEPEEQEYIREYKGQTTKSQLLNARLCQSFFRRAVLSSYRNICCVCELDLPPLLTASHIIPWSKSEQLRADPQNGLCLCALHDRAFDRGIISVDDSLKITVSSLTDSSSALITEQTLKHFRNERIRLPQRFSPNSEYLRWHHVNIFKG